VFEEVVENPDKFKPSWIDEYTRVVTEYDMVQNSPVTIYKESDLIILQLTSPVHYYALFSRSRTYDIVVSIYPGAKYEVEIKYTTMVDLNSRPCLPRLEMIPLSKHLNYLEEKLDRRFKDNFRWKADRITDSGPMLRIESVETGNISKVDRYAHPYERPIYPSSINMKDFELLVSSYFAHGNKQANRRKDWEWDELHDFNQKVNWDMWRTSLPKHLQ
jgi:hypothetical protein